MIRHYTTTSHWQRLETILIITLGQTLLRHFLTKNILCLQDATTILLLIHSIAKIQE